jgi:LPXTG-site transpeptidase (sortase) family protein
MKSNVLVKILLSFVFSLGVVLLLPKGAAEYTLGQETTISTEGEILDEAATTEDSDQRSFEKIIPEHLSIPSVEIDVDVKEAYVNENDWVLYNNAASYLNTSAGLSEFGNSVLYAHNTQNLFADLKNVMPGDRVHVQSGGRAYSYVVTETMEISPTQLDIVYSTDDERITIFTCTNINYENRFVVVAKRSTTFGDLI